MKISFARKYQAGAAIAGTLGGTEAAVGATGGAAAGDALASGGTGATINPSVLSGMSQSGFGKYGGLINAGLDLVDFGTDMWAAKAWEKQAKEKIKEERELKDAASKSMALRRAALQQASIFDNGGGAAMLAASGLSNLAGIGLYHANNPDYSGAVRTLATRMTNHFLQQPPTAQGNAGDIYNYTAEGVAPGGQQPGLVNTTPGRQGTVPSANQTSATGTLGPVAAKYGTKLIRRVK